MDRELKFRLINDGKIVGYETHELDTPGGTINIYHNDLNIEAVEDAYIPHDSKDQYTGLKDKNGVEIYDGDIVEANGRETVYIGRTYATSKVGVYNFIVAWSESFASWIFSHPVGSINCEVGSRDYKVIGDKYTTPELMEQK